MPDYTQLVLNNRRLGLPKAVVSPDLKSATVLTNEPWEYVDLYLARQGTAPATEARFYWQQSREFFNASIGLGLQAAPLCLYYSFMNATKALLRARSVSFKEHHGVASWKLDASSKLIDLSVGIKIKTDGVLPALSHYYNESERSNTHTLSDIFFNLPFIHRTYSLTNHPIKEIFIPLVRPSFVFDGASRAIRVMANLTADYPDPRHCKNLPQSFDWHIADGRYFLLSKQSAEISSTSDPTADDLEKLICLAKRIREDVYYISGMDTLWYAKAMPMERTRIQRQSTTLTLAAMHRLSEECRYHPKDMAECLQHKNNWLVSEFIRMSGVQFIDEIASEITGHQILRPNVRPAG